MKRFVLLMIFAIMAIQTFSQAKDAEDIVFQKAYDACISMRDAVGANDKEAEMQLITCRLAIQKSLILCDVKVEKNQLMGICFLMRYLPKPWLMVRMFTFKQTLLVKVERAEDKLQMAPY